MEARINKPATSSLLLIAVTVLIACWGLFWIDHETRSWSDLFTSGNLVALILYYVPTFVISYFLYVLFLKKNENGKSLVLSLLIGIPLSFTFVIFVLLWVMNRI